MGIGRFQGAVIFDSSSLKPRRINARPAHGGLGDLELEREFLLHSAENLDGFAHDFGTNTVTSQRGDLERF